MEVLAQSLNSNFGLMHQNCHNSLDQEVGNDTSLLGIMDSSGSNYAYQTQATNLVETPG
jgi:hypothetical protein